jgi:transposase-like protein
MRHEVIIGVERRRSWTDEQKLSILSEVGIGGSTVADVARRHDIPRQHIYQWRRQLRDRGLWPLNVRIMVRWPRSRRLVYQSQAAVRKWPLEVRDPVRRSRQPVGPLLWRRQDHRHGLRVDGFYLRVRRAGEEGV